MSITQREKVKCDLCAVARRPVAGQKDRVRTLIPRLRRIALLAKQRGESNGSPTIFRSVGSRTNQLLISREIDMKMCIASSIVFALGITGVLLHSPCAVAQIPSEFSVVASGLNAPRGLTFGPDGDLYVAEAGEGGSVSTAGQCPQVSFPPGPYTGGSTGEIVKVNSKGTVTVVASGFASAQDAVGDLLGVADVAFLDGQLYALIDGGGCSHGNPNSPNGIAKVNVITHKWSLIADLSEFAMTHPGEYINPLGFEPDGDWFKMVPYDGKLIAVNPNSGILAAVLPDGRAQELIDVSKSQGKVTPTGIAEHEGDLYVGTLRTFPILPQWEEVMRLEKSDEAHAGALPGFKPHSEYFVAQSRAGFTTVVAVNIGPDGLLYALELSDLAGNPAPGNGKVIRVQRSGELEEVITGLNVPTGMTWGPDGDLYISDFSAVPAPHFGAGRILRFNVAYGY
jgi:hypothetical protein